MDIGKCCAGYTLLFHPVELLFPFKAPYKVDYGEMVLAILT
ncbi:MAG: hypothetical protein ACTSWP_07390 [Candidatus Freyarchaeota archaeon]|nr:hypothetical protein [Candidatus Freyrarchaeum guaymaensis]